jgi:hypothetical protein
MKRMPVRTVLAATLAIGALALGGCAADPDVAGLEAGLSEAAGVNGAMVYTTHSGAPWNTQVQVLLFVDDPSDEGLVTAVRGAAPVLAEDPVASRHEVTIRLIDGERSDYPDRFAASADEITVLPTVFDALGVPDTGPYSLTLQPDEVRAIAEGA